MCFLVKKQFREVSCSLVDVILKTTRLQDNKTTSCRSDVVMWFFYLKKQFREVSCGLVDVILKTTRLQDNKTTRQQDYKL